MVMFKCASEITNDAWDGALEGFVDMLTGEQILDIPGVYEIMSEHFNNDIIDALVDPDIDEAGSKAGD